MQQPKRAPEPTDRDEADRGYEDPPAAARSADDQRAGKAGHGSELDRGRHFKRRIDCSPESAEPAWSRGRYR
jgi:hypothetical protein